MSLAESASCLCCNNWRTTCMTAERSDRFIGLMNTFPLSKNSVGAQLCCCSGSRRHM
jgi:hypothetical protein